MFSLLKMMFSCPFLIAILFISTASLAFLKSSVIFNLKLNSLVLSNVSPKKGSLLTTTNSFTVKLAKGKLLKRLKSVSLKVTVAFTELFMVFETIATILSLNK